MNNLNASKDSIYTCDINNLQSNFQKLAIKSYNNHGVFYITGIYSKNEVEILRNNLDLLYKENGSNRVRIIKDIQDLEGDQDRKTLPTRIGVSNALNLAVFILLVAISLSYTAINSFENLARTAYIGGITLANGIMLLGIYNSKLEDYFSGQKNIKQGMGVAMLAFILAAGLA